MVCIFTAAATVGTNIETKEKILKNIPWAFAKKGVPGNWKFVQVGKTVISGSKIQEIAREIIEESEIKKDGFINPKVIETQRISAVALDGNVRGRTLATFYKGS